MPSFLLLSAFTLCAQQTPQPQAFEVISIKPNASTDDRVMIRMAPGGSYTATGIPVRVLLTQAYNIRDFQISAGPGWIASERYDIQAKAAEGTAERMTVDLLRPMLQNLLAERFQLKTHIESREMPVYSLIPGKGGPKLASAAPADPARPPMVRIGRGMLSAEAITIQALAQQLSQVLGRPVIDNTGLKGLYQVHLEFAPEPGQGAMGPGGTPPPTADTPPGDPNIPSIFVALQEKLGLKLESARGPVDILVIDSISKPAQN
ncbi:hypothetical protein F183_A42100 [Bryobacterales bacterium F-183]|nr:hypothetical protein F183_A42100 [Bryobacterales bacterium F-183]